MLHSKAYQTDGWRQGLGAVYMLHNMAYQAGEGECAEDGNDV